MNTLLQQILDACRPYTKEGRVANYIPELAKADMKRYYGGRASAYRYRHIFARVRRQREQLCGQKSFGVVE